MSRAIWFVAIASAWTTALVVVGALAGWTFIAVQGAGITSVSDPRLQSADPILLARFVGGQITRAPFDIMVWVSLFVPPLLASMLGGTSAKIDWSRLAWRRRTAVIACGLAFLCVVGSLLSSVQLREASHTYWDAIGGNIWLNLAAIDTAHDALFAIHTRARNLYVALVALAAATTVTGALFLTRRASLILRP